MAFKNVYRSIFKDPSVGGVCGSNLSRFLIARFPDPVTESLAWWKKIWQYSDNPDLKTVAIEAGNPPLGNVSIESRTKLLETPEALNIPGAKSSETVLRESVLTGLTKHMNQGLIRNQPLTEALRYQTTYKDSFVTWLFTIVPVFPRFLTELYTSTYFSLYQFIPELRNNEKTVFETSAC